MKSFLKFSFWWMVYASWLAPEKCQAQNLVPNPSFEEYTQCPWDLSMAELATGWIQPGGGTTDLFHTCSTGTVGVPYNVFGYQPPRTGKGYAGIHNYLTGNTYREYAQIKLTEPLRKDSVYHVEFYVNLSNNYRVAINNLGAYISVAPPQSLGYGLLDNVLQEPQIRNHAGYQTDTLNWMKIEGNFLAAGGEEYLTIGNFDDDAHTNTSNSKNSEVFAAYYYIDDVSVSLSACPIVTDLGPNKLLCPGDTTTLYATSRGATYRWQDGSTQASLRIHAPGTYWVDVQYGTCTFRDSVQIDYLDHLPKDLLRDTTLCANQSLYLDATYPGAIRYQWQDGLTTPTKWIYSPGVYWVDIDFGGCVYRDSVQIGYQDQINKIPDYLVVCEGEPFLLDATTPGATYRWQDGSTNPTFTATQVGYYSVEIRLGNCTFYDYAQVVNPYHEPVFPQKQLFLCKDQTALLNASSMSGPYHWQDGSSESTFLVTQPGRYWVDYYSNNCLTRDSIRVDNLDHFPKNRLRDTTICNTQPLYLDASYPGAIGYLWQDGYTWASRTIYSAGSYWVDIDFGACVYRDSIRIGYQDQANKLPDYTSLCNGKPLLLDATTEGATYLWNNGSTQPTLTVTQAGSYWVAIKIGSCTFYDYAQVDYSTPPKLFPTNEIILCPGETTLLNTSWLTGPYQWQDGSTNSTYLVTTPGKYRVSFSWYGCPVSDSVTVRYTADAPLPFPKEISLCQGQSIVLDASPLNSWYYQWSTGNSGAILQVSQPGTYSLVTIWNNCTVQFSTKVSYYPTPVVTIKNDTTLCYGRSLVLQAVGSNQRFRWSDNSAGAFLTIREPGEYWLEVQDKTTGCTTRKTIEISQTECWEELVIPNVITPHNGDALNQAFVIDELTDHWSLEIVNRWGTSVYQTPSYRNDWQGDGLVGLYYYILRNTVSGQAYRGWLQVLQ